MKSPFIVRRVALGVALLASAITLGAPAHQPGRALVSYGDLDLSQPEATHVLYRRISIAARRVCKEPSLRDLNAKRAFDYCYRTAVTAAVEKVNNRELTALARAKFQREAAG
jgi:UrcA family protein